jgi:hypothetical protein
MEMVLHILFLVGFFLKKNKTSDQTKARGKIRVVLNRWDLDAFLAAGRMQTYLDSVIF